MAKGHKQYKQLIDSNFNKIADRIKTERKNSNKRRGRKK